MTKIKDIIRKWLGDEVTHLPEKSFFIKQRKARQLSVATIADLSEVSHSTIYRIEKGYDVRYKQIKKLFKFYMTH